MSPAADGNVFTDLSGTSNSTTGNPYDALLEACKQEPVLETPSWAFRMAGKLIPLETNPASLSDAPRDSQWSTKKQAAVSGVLGIHHRRSAAQAYQPSGKPRIHRSEELPCFLGETARTHPAAGGLFAEAAT